MCLLLGAAGVGKTLLVKRLQNILPRRVGRQGVPGRVGREHTGVAHHGNSSLCHAMALDRRDS
jgi:GTPase SAR1 family protein